MNEKQLENILTEEIPLEGLAIDSGIYEFYQDGGYIVCWYETHPSLYTFHWEIVKKSSIINKNKSEVIIVWDY